MGRLRFLNALRTLAALWVVQVHCILWGGFKIWFPNPELAVDVFMMLSGVLMVATVESREAQQPLSRLSTWLTFYSRRFFRLAPLYYLCLAVAVLTSTWFIGGYQVLFDMYPARWGGATSEYNPAFASYSMVSLLLHVTFVFGLLPHYVFSRVLT